MDLLQAARAAVSALPTVNTASQLKRVTRKVVQAHQVLHWNKQLDTLTVQSKLKDIIVLESDCKVWTKIQSGLPAVQSSFLLRAGSDCLPTPLNLCRWRIQTDPKYPLCSSPKPTSMHILNGCATALNQGRYTWSHDSVLQSIAKALIIALNKRGKLYADLPGLRASNNPPATVPTDHSNHLTGPTW